MTERWIGSHRGVVDAVERSGRQWRIRIGPEWFTTKANSPINRLIGLSLIGHTVTVSYEKVSNPKDRRVHHIQVGMYPTLPGMDQGR